MTRSEISVSSVYQRGLNAAALFMPYIIVWLGLYVFHNAWAAILGYHAGIVILVTLAGAWPSARQVFASPSRRGALLYGLVGTSAGISMYFLLPYIHISPRLSIALLEWGLTPHIWPIFIIYGTLVNPWLEEIFWRSWLGSTDRNPVFRDAAFAGFHLVILAPFFPLIWLVVAFFVLAFSGWMWRQVVRVEESLLASSLFHLAADVSILLVVWSTMR